MSACISREGEYSEHVVQDDYTCGRCNIQAEDLMAWLLERAIDRLTDLCDETGWHGWDVQVPKREGEIGYHGHARVWKLEPRGNWYGDTPEDEQDELVPTGVIATTEFNSRAEADAIVVARSIFAPAMAILEAALNDSEGSHDEPGAYGQAVDLARSILAPTSRDWSQRLPARSDIRQRGNDH